MAWTVDWRVTINGRDVSSAMRPFLLDITVSDKDGTASDSCQLSFDDTGGQVALPADGAALQVFIDGAMIFAGTVDNVRSSGSRGGGRTLAIGAKGFDARGKVKSGQRWHLDDATLDEALQKSAKAAGLSRVVVDPAFAGIARDYWSPRGETFLGWAGKLAREMGATFKIRGDTAVFANRGTGLSAVGEAMPAVSAAVGRNLISWDIAPVTNRGRFSKARVRFFDRSSASFKSKDVSIETGDEVEASDEVQTLAADEAQADDIASGRKSQSEREGGEGTVEIDLDPTAQAEGTLVLFGARPGIDGTYRIVGVTHRASRSSGATSSIEIKQPQGAAGQDSRIPVPTPRPA